MYTANITFDVKKDGEDFCNVSLNYNAMTYGHICFMEGKLINMLKEMQSEGEKQAAAKQ